MKSIDLYSKYHSSRKDERLGLFLVLRDGFQIDRVLYLGCFVHVTPSFVFEDCVYIDTMKSAGKFFESPDAMKLVNARKIYDSSPKFKFYKQCYNESIEEKEESFGLLISQYAGFISTACKKYLKKGVFLVVNNSHGDATMAHLDPDFELVEVYNRVTDEKYRLNDKDLDQHFVPKKSEVTIEELKEKQRGTGYIKSRVDMCLGSLGSEPVHGRGIWI